MSKVITYVDAKDYLYDLPREVSNEILEATPFTSIRGGILLIKYCFVRNIILPEDILEFARSLSHDELKELLVKEEQSVSEICTHDLTTAEAEEVEALVRSLSEVTEPVWTTYFQSVSMLGGNTVEELISNLKENFTYIHEHLFSPSNCVYSNLSGYYKMYILNSTYKTGIFLNHEYNAIFRYLKTKGITDIEEVIKYINTHGDTVLSEANVKYYKWYTVPTNKETDVVKAKTVKEMQHGPPIIISYKSLNGISAPEVYLQALTKAEDWDRYCCKGDTLKAVISALHRKGILKEDMDDLTITDTIVRTRVELSNNIYLDEYVKALNKSITVNLESIPSEEHYDDGDKLMSYGLLNYNLVANTVMYGEQHNPILQQALVIIHNVPYGRDLLLDEVILTAYLSLRRTSGEITNEIGREVFEEAKILKPYIYPLIKDSFSDKQGIDLTLKNELCLRGGFYFQGYTTANKLFSALSALMKNEEGKLNEYLREIDETILSLDNVHSGVSDIISWNSAHIKNMVAERFGIREYSEARKVAEKLNGYVGVYEPYVFILMANMYGKVNRAKIIHLADNSYNSGFEDAKFIIVSNAMEIESTDEDIEKVIDQLCITADKNELKRVGRYRLAITKLHGPISPHTDILN